MEQHAIYKTISRQLLPSHLLRPISVQVSSIMVFNEIPVMKIYCKNNLH